MIMTKGVLVLMIFLTLDLGNLFNEKKVDLLETGLIDLEKAIEFAPFGEGSDGAEEDEISDASEEEKTETGAGIGNGIETIVFYIRGKKLRCRGQECTLPEAEEKIRNSNALRIKVRLVDDYADSKTYKETDKMIRELSSSMGFEYEEQ